MNTTNSTNSTGIDANYIWVDPNTVEAVGGSDYTVASIPLSGSVLAFDPFGTSAPIEVPASATDRSSYVTEDPSPGDDGYAWALRPDDRRTILVEPGQITLPDGKVITRTLKYNTPITYELVEALKWAEKIDCYQIRVRGNINGGVLGGGDMNKADVVKWTGRPIHDIVVRSDDPDNMGMITQLDFAGDIRSATGNTGVSKVLFKKLIISNKYYPSTGSSTRQGVLVMSSSYQGLIGIHDCEFRAADPTAFQGNGMMWGIRGHGRARWDIRRNTFPKLQEHCVYVDGVGADGGGPTFICGNKSTGPTGRTGIQIVNRKTVSMGGGPEGLGPVFIQRNSLWSDGHGGGGAVITVAGHSGPVYIEDNDIRAEGESGGIVMWSDGGKGLFTTPDGFTCPYARIINNRIDATGCKRSITSYGGVKELIIDEFSFKGSSASIDLFNSYVGHIDNGKVFITAGIENGAVPLSQYAGFASGIKMKYKNKTLTAAQIDAYRADA